MSQSKFRQKQPGGFYLKQSGNINNNTNNNIKLLPVGGAAGPATSTTFPPGSEDVRSVKSGGARGCSRGDEEALAAKSRMSDSAATFNMFRYRHAFFHQTNGSNSFTFRELTSAAEKLEKGHPA